MLKPTSGINWGGSSDGGGGGGGILRKGEALSYIPSKTKRKTQNLLAKGGRALIVAVAAGEAHPWNRLFERV